MQTTVIVFFLAIWGSVQSCDVITAIEGKIQGMIDTSLLDFKAAGTTCYMGMKSGAIPNIRITASSFWGARHEPYRARLDNIYMKESTGSWSSKTNQVGQFLRIDLGAEMKVAGVITQGRPNNPNYNQWVKSYKVKCGNTLGNLPLVNNVQGNQVFIGNSDTDTKVYGKFDQVMSCRYVEIHALTWNKHISLRAEIVKGACYSNSFIPY